MASRNDCSLLSPTCMKISVETVIAICKINVTLEKEKKNQRAEPQQSRFEPRHARSFYIDAP
jgi:hypothetical protein